MLAFLVDHRRGWGMKIALWLYEILPGPPGSLKSLFLKFQKTKKGQKHFKKIYGWCKTDFLNNLLKVVSTFTMAITCWISPEQVDGYKYFLQARKFM